MVRNGLMPVARMEGATRNGRAAVLVAGSGHAADLLLRRLFPGGARSRDIAKVPVWRADSYIRKMASGADLTMICTDKLSDRLLFRSECLRVPDSIQVGLRTPEEIETLWRSNHSLQQDIRLVRSRGMEMSISREDADFEMFYRTMYLPFLTARHGDMARPRDKHWLHDQFLRGKIIWALREEERLAGVVVTVQDRVMHVLALATRHGDPGPMKGGAVSALYLYAIEHAREQGCSFIDFGISKGFLGDGILRYKRKWGMEIRPAPYNQSFVRIGWAAWNDTVAKFLEDAAVVHQNRDVLRVVTASVQVRPGSQADAARIHRSVFMPGIDRVVIVNSAGWEENIVAPVGTVLLGGRPGAAQLADI